LPRARQEPPARLGEVDALLPPPRRVSSKAICRLNAGCVTCSRAAAAVTLPVSAAATK